MLLSTALRTASHCSNLTDSAFASGAGLRFVTYSTSARVLAELTAETVKTGEFFDDEQLFGRDF